MQPALQRFNLKPFKLGQDIVITLFLLSAADNVLQRMGLSIMAKTIERPFTFLEPRVRNLKGAFLRNQILPVLVCSLSALSNSQL